MGGSGIDRRSLLGAASVLSAAGTAAAAAPAAPPKAVGQPLLGTPDLPLPPGQRLRFAIVGLGTFSMGQAIPGIVASDRCRMTAFVSGNPDKAKKLAADYGVERLYDYDTFDRIADDPDIDAVYIALPVALHAEYAIRAFKAGKHVFTEKPMASTVADCEAMIAAAKAANRQLGVAYRVHFEPNTVEALRRLKSGEFGELRYFSGDAGFDANPNYPPHKWRLQKALAGGGSMYDIGIYALNAALMFVDESPTSVTAVYSYPRNDPRFGEVEGGVEWRLRFPSGISAQGSSSYCYSYITRQRLYCSKGSINMDPASDYSHVDTVVQHADLTPTLIRGPNPILQFQRQFDGFAAAVAEGRPHLTPGEMGLRDIKLIQAIYRSADNDGRIVQL